MYSVRQIRRAEKSIVQKVAETHERIHFNVIYIDRKQQKHEHDVVFVKNKPLIDSFRCDCYWGSYYGWDKRNKHLSKLCVDSLAVGKFLKIPEILEILV